MSKKYTILRFQTHQQASKPAIPIGKKQRLHIERLSDDGRGIAKLHDITWFVAGALPNEDVEARVLAVKKHQVDARCEQILMAAANRQEPACQYANTCGGCQLQHINYDEQIALKQNMVHCLFRKIANITLDCWQPPLLSKPLEYRRRARLAVRYNEQTNRLDIGFRAAFSQHIVNISDCPILTKPLRNLLVNLPQCLNQLTGKRLIGHIELFDGNTSALLVRHIAPLATEDLNLLRNFCSKMVCQLWLQGKDQPQPDQQGSSLFYELDDKIKLHYAMGDFLQVNANVNQAMINQALNWLNLKPTERVLDLFSGLGNFSLPLATQAKEVIGVEVVENMVKLATHNAQCNNIGNTRFYQSDLSATFNSDEWLKAGVTKILLDPPREGAYKTVRAIQTSQVQKILYVSCNPSTLARDSRVLIDQGYTIRKVAIMDMFAQTAHVETMVLFEKF